MSRFFITGGGTGGHIYPAIAVADALNDDEIFYVGNPKNLEFDIVKQKGYKFLGINVHGMPRVFGFDLLKWIFQLSFAIFKCCFWNWRICFGSSFISGKNNENSLYDA